MNNSVTIHKYFIGIICALGVVMPDSMLLAGISYRTIALSGQPAPGTDPGEVFDKFGFPLIDAQGRIAIFASVAGDDVSGTNDFAIWSQTPGALTLVAREGSPAPGMGTGVVFENLAGSGSPVFSTSGHIAFQATLTGGDVTEDNDLSLWSDRSGSLALIAHEGDVAPGADATFSGFGFPLINASGEVAFIAGLRGPTVDSDTNSSTWVESNGALRLVAREGFQADGFLPGSLYDLTDELGLSDQGGVAFRGRVYRPGASRTATGVWNEGSGSPGAPALIVNQYGVAPGTEPGVVFDEVFTRVTVDAQGHVTFRGSLTGDGVDATNSRGIWSERTGELELVVRTGQLAPGLADGVVFTGVGNPVVDGTGTMAFFGSFFGPGVDYTNELGIWLSDSESLRLVARDGDPAPGTEPGVVFDGIGTYIPNASGQVAVKGFLNGPGIDGSNDTGVWLIDSNGTISLVARHGDLFDVNDDPTIEDLKTITWVDYRGHSTGDNGHETSFNDAGELALRMRFSDGTEGVFVATIPEPATGMTILFGVLGVMRRYGPAC